eukprot:2195697-Alexandrium_andersonii.AAC.1
MRQLHPRTTPLAKIDRRPRLPLDEGAIPEGSQGEASLSVDAIPSIADVGTRGATLAQGPIGTARRRGKVARG